MKNIKTAYMAPMVEVLNARVEKGFAGSTVTPTPDGPANPRMTGGYKAVDTDFD
jgi:hypothetical protein